MSKHSPGPWTAECVGVSSVGPDGEDVYQVNSQYRRVAEYVAERDARLIAEAPAMLEALKRSAGVLSGELMAKSELVSTLEDIRTIFKRIGGE